jgi:hypothetical protein
MEKVFKCKDLYLAGYLIAEGQTLERTNRESGECWFVFKEQNTSEKLANHYWNGTGKCYGKAYADAIRTLKDIIFSAQPRKE